MNIREANINNIYYNSALPGKGKTEAFIKEIDNNPYFLKRIVYASATKVLASSVRKRLESRELPLHELNSSTVRNKPISYAVEEALLELEPKVLLITHKTLAAIDHSFLEGWEVYIDEDPAIEEIRELPVGEAKYETHFEKYAIPVTGNELQLNDAYKYEARLVYQEGRDEEREDHLTVFLGALLSDRHKVYATKHTSKKKRHANEWLIRTVGLTDYTGIYDNAKCTTFLGSNIHKGLALSLARQKGYNLIDTTKKAAYANCPILFPLVNAIRNSKAMMYTDPLTGKLSTNWEAGNFGEAMFHQAMRVVGDRKAIIAVHAYMDLPFHEYPNLTVVPMDCRGLNDYSDYECSISLVHGNPSPTEDASRKDLARIAGVDYELVKDALDWRRLNDLNLQIMARVKIRLYDNTEQTYHIVPTYGDARRLMQEINSTCIIDTSHMIEPPKSYAKRGQEDNSQIAKGLKASGLSNRKIAEKMGVTHRTIGLWLK